jgi:hypothetical protein
MRARAAFFTFFLLGSIAGTATAAPFAEGFRKCQECHEPEVEVWKQTKHFKSYNEIHKKESAAKILAAAGGGASMRQNSTCVMCHYTETKASETAKPQVASGPSCESCHGASSEFRDVHNFYGDGVADASKETAANKAKRIAAATKAGMIWSFMTYDVAANCMDCHGLAQPRLKGDVLAKMLEAGHPGEPEFELVRYSQGSVRHRYYPPNVNTNAEMNAADLARLYIVGQAAKLVSATTAAGKSTQPQYAALQKKREQASRSALQAVADVPEVKAVLDKPSADTARRMADALKGKDLSAKVKAQLPAKNTYK